MKIIVFDDDLNDRKKLLYIINSWIIDGSHPETIVREFDSIRNLSFSLSGLLQTDVFFLDIITPKSYDAGYRLAEEIRAKNIRAAIIFTTISTEYIADAFEIFTYRYLIKPVHPEKVYEALDHISSSRSYTGRYATVFHGTEDELLIENDQILYLESNARSHQATVFLINGASDSIRLTGPFSQLIDSVLPQEFTQCHRGYIINLKHVKRYGFDVTIYTIWSTAVLFLIGLVLQQFPASLIIVLGFYTFQTTGGGYHAKTHLKCLLTMIVGLLVGLSFVFFNNNHFILWTLLGVGALLLLLFPLVLHPNKAYLETERKRLTIRSVIMTLSII